jgi:hypothetical protein
MDEYACPFCGLHSQIIQITMYERRFPGANENNNNQVTETINEN